MPAQNRRWVSSWVILLVALLPACAAVPQPVSLAGVPLKPGRYLQAYYFAPDFVPAKAAYELTPFTLEETRRVSRDVVLRVFQAELAKAWEANGLTVASPKEATCQVRGTVHLVSVQGASLRFFFGKISGQMDVSGTISRGEQVLLAFRDRVSVESPLSPGPAAPKETELLLQLLCREFAQRLLNEMLLHGLIPDSG